MATRRLPDDIDAALAELTGGQVRRASDDLGRDLGRDRDLALARDLGRDLARGRALDLGRALGLDVALARDLARDLELARDRDLALGLDLDLGLARGLGLRFGRDLGLARDLGLELDRALARGLGLGRDLGRGLDLARDLELALARDRDLALDQLAKSSLRASNYELLVDYARESGDGTPEAVGRLFFYLLVIYVWYPACVAWAISEEDTTNQPGRSDTPASSVAELVALTVNNNPTSDDRSAVQRSAEPLIAEATNLYQEGVWADSPAVEEDVYNTINDLNRALHPVDPDREFSVPIVNGHLLLLIDRLAALDPTTSPGVSAAAAALERHEANPSDDDFSDIYDVVDGIEPIIEPGAPAWLGDQEVWDTFSEAADDDPKRLVALLLGWIEPAGTDLDIAYERLVEKWNDAKNVTPGEFIDRAVEAAGRREQAVTGAVDTGYKYGRVGGFVGGAIGVGFPVRVGIGAAGGGILGLVIGVLMAILGTRYRGEDND